MGKTNWKRVFLGGLVAGVVFNVLVSIAWAIYLKKSWSPTIEHLNPTFQETIGFQAFSIVFWLIVGILAVWFYSAIRPRYGAGPKTALIAGISYWVIGNLLYVLSLISMGLFPTNMLVTDSLTALVMSVVATLAGAWIYKEQ